MARMTLSEYVFIGTHTNLTLEQTKASKLSGLGVDAMAIVQGRNTIYIAREDIEGFCRAIVGFLKQTGMHNG